MSVSPNPTYASELFGAGHAAITYPDKMTPVVTLSIPRNVNARAASGSGDSAVIACPARNHDGVAEVTFTLLAGTFDGNVTGLMWDPIKGTTTAEAAASAPKTATSAVASIESGGRKGDNSITIKIAAATNESAPANADTARSSASSDYLTGEGNNAKCNLPTGDSALVDQTISFNLPKLAGLGALAGANIADTDTKNDEKVIYLRAESRIISGAFSDGFISGSPPHYVAPVVKARDSVTLSITPKAATKTIVLKGDSAFKAVKEANPKTGYVELATVTVTTKQPNPATAVAGSKRVLVGKLRATGATSDAAADQELYKPAVTAKPATPYMLYDLDGEDIDEGLRGTLSVNAMGTRDLFNDGDVLFIDYDKNGKMGSGEGIAIDGNMGMGDALSVDPDKSASFDKGGTGTFKVYYMPGGKGDINHGAMINLTAMVDYSDPTAIDEKAVKSSTTLNYDGVTGEVKAYAIPHSTNGTGDKANVRVRCETSTGCRVFLECWDDDGMRGFGQAGMIAGNALMKWTSSDIEGVIGVTEPTSRHSCRILAVGNVTVQQLTRDGNSKTLVNNTYVGM